jgi:hypothetical protein
MKQIIILFISFTIISLYSCEDFFETTITIDPPKHEPKLALIAIGNEGDVEIIARLTQSAGILEADSLVKPISNAKFNATLNGKSVAVTEVRDLENEPVYKISLGQALVANDVVEIKVDFPGFKTLEAKAKLPVKPSVTNIVFTREGGKDGFGDQISKLSFDYESSDPTSFFKVEVGEEVYFCTDFDPITYDCLKYDTTLYYNPLTINDPSVTTEGYVKKKIEDGKKKNYIGQIYRNDVKRTFYIVNMSEESFEYEVSKIQYENSVDNPFATPVNVKTNIINGFGYFALNNTYVFTP